VPCRMIAIFFAAHFVHRGGQSRERFSMRCLFALLFAVFFPFAGSGMADELLCRYEGDVLPYDESAGWQVFRACTSPCTESLVDGRFVLSWPVPNRRVNYHHDIAWAPTTSPPPTLWVEWRFRSNHPLGPFFTVCDASFSLYYKSVHAPLDLYGDAVISFSGSDYLLGLELFTFHTYRFESPNGVDFWYSVDGNVFYVGQGIQSNPRHYIQFRGSGGCNGDWIPNMVNEWDFVRYGTLSYGELIVAADPPEGLLDARQHAGLDRFLITFDEPSYVYIDDITVQVTDALTGLPMPELVPTVSKTRRREPPDSFDVEDDPRIVEIVLDRPIPFHATTRFTFDDGVAVNVVEYAFAPGDADGSGTVDLLDVAYLLNCLDSTDTADQCGVFDWDRNALVDHVDALDVLALVQDPVR
jgi:hypothetical protein